MNDAGARALSRTALFALVSGLLILNLATFFPAFSQVSSIDTGCCSDHPLAKDFSAFFIGAWRLFHDPAQIYTHAYVSDGEPFIYPQPEQYKYLPSFLLIISPLLLVPYPEALALFDIFQFLSLPLIGLLVYDLTKEQDWGITVIAEVLVLLLPAAAPGWGFSVGYFWQWKEGQSKVLEALFLTASFYLGRKGRSVWSGVSLGFAFFDPRFALVAIPLFLASNVTKTSSAIKALAATLILSNLALVYPGVGFSFLGMVFNTGISTALYPYAMIPLAEVVFLSSINHSEIKNELVRIYRISQVRMIRARIRSSSIRRARI